MPALRQRRIGVGLTVLRGLRFIGTRDQVRRLNGDEDHEKRGEGRQETTEERHVDMWTSIAHVGFGLATRFVQRCGEA